MHLRNIDGQARSYLYQYKIGDYYTVNSNKAKLMQAWNSLSRQSDFSEIRAISIIGNSDFSAVKNVLQDEFMQLTIKDLSFE